MFTTFLFILTAIHSVPCNCLAHEGKTALAVKQGIQNYTNSIPIGITDFKELALKSKIFIDNTLLCKEIMQPTRSWTIVSPGQWGRSTLLTMLKAFLEIQVDETGNRILPRQSTTNYKLFKKGEITHEDGRIERLRTPLLIADQDETIKYHLGKYPVIYVSFQDAIGKNYIEVHRKIAIAIEKAHKQHEYMMTVLKRKCENNTDWRNDIWRFDFETFTKYLNVTKQSSLPKLQDLLASLVHLSRLLKRYFGEKICLLIDDYDVPLLNAINYYDELPSEEAHSLFSSFNRFHTELANAVDFRRVIQMGTILIRFDAYNRYNKEDIVFEQKYGEAIRSSPLREYFGFKQSHVEFLFEKHELSQKLEQAKKWYSGYKSTASLKQNFYNPASILQFLFHRQFAYYGHPRSKFADFIQNALQQDLDCKDDLLVLVRGGESNISRFFKSDQHFTFLGQAADHMLHDLYYSILSVELRVAINQPGLNALPNYEVTLLISRWLISYYKEKYHISDQHLNNAAVALRNYITLDGVVESLKKSLEQLYDSSVLQVNQTESVLDREDPSHAILNCVALQMKSMSNFEVCVSYNDTAVGPLVIYVHEREHGIVMELERNHISAKTAYERAEKSVNQLRKSFPDIKKANAIGINIFSNKSIDILAKAVSV